MISAWWLLAAFGAGWFAGYVWTVFMVNRTEHQIRRTYRVERAQHPDQEDTP